MTKTLGRFLRQLGLVLVATAALAGAPAQAGTAGQTKYPIVLVHGLFGFDAIGPIDYFYGIPSALASDGARVFIAQVSATNSSEVRGEQLLAQVKTVLAITGAAKVNLIGHSHGGPTVRYVSGVRPDLVASITSVAGVNRGSRVADVVRGVAPAGSITEAVANTAVNALVSLINLLSGGTGLPQMPLAALDSLTTAGAAKFNAKFPAGVPTSGCGDGAASVNGVRYYSWTGNRLLTNVLDVSDGPLGLTGLVHGEANDGLVTVCSSKLGTSLGVYSQNHLDEVNQVVGLTDWFSVNPVTLYRQHAARLKAAGL